MAISFIIGNHNQTTNASAISINMSQAVVAGDTIVAAVDVIAASVSSITVSATIGSFVQKANETVNGSSLWVIASASSGASNLSLSCTFTGALTNGSMMFLHYRGVLGGTGNTATNSGKSASPNEKVTITKQASGNFIVGCLMNKTTGATTWVINAGSTMRNNGTGGAGILTEAGVDDNNAGAVGSVSVGAIASSGVTTLTWSAVGVELQAAVAAAAGLLPARNLLGVGMALSRKARENIVHRRIMFGFTELKYGEPVFAHG